MTDVGGGGESVPASKALIFMVNAINDRFKLTVAHFFVDNLNGKGKYILVTYLLFSISLGKYLFTYWLINVVLKSSLKSYYTHKSCLTDNS